MQENVKKQPVWVAFSVFPQIRFAENSLPAVTVLCSEEKNLPGVFAKEPRFSGTVVQTGPGLALFVCRCREEGIGALRRIAANAQFAENLHTMDVGECLL